MNQEFKPDEQHLIITSNPLDRFRGASIVGFLIHAIVFAHTSCGAVMQLSKPCKSELMDISCFRSMHEQKGF